MEEPREVVLYDVCVCLCVCALRFRCVHDARSADELSPVCGSQTQSAAQEASGYVLRPVSG